MKEVQRKFQKEMIAVQDEDLMYTLLCATAIAERDGFARTVNVLYEMIDALSQYQAKRKFDQMFSKHICY